MTYTATKDLTLSATDGFYYAVLPSGHDSEGVFTFSVDRASLELNKTIEYLKGKADFRVSNKFQRSVNIEYLKGKM